MVMEVGVAAAPIDASNPRAIENTLGDKSRETKSSGVGERTARRRNQESGAKPSGTKLYRLRSPRDPRYRINDAVVDGRRAQGAVKGFVQVFCCSNPQIGTAINFARKSDLRRVASERRWVGSRF
jgi:hypothetical protein